MKKAFKYLLVLILIVVIVISSIFFLYKDTVISNLTEKEDVVRKDWTELFDKTGKRIQLLKDKNFYGDVNFTELNKAIELNAKNRTTYENENSLLFLKLEFDVNKAFVDLQNENKFIESKNLDNLISNGYEINMIVNRYNQNVKDYNKYLSTFPNFIFAKGHNFKRKIFFNLKYGKVDEDPIIKSREIPEWAKDTL